MSNYWQKRTLNELDSAFNSNLNQINSYLAKEYNRCFKEITQQIELLYDEILDSKADAKRFYEEHKDEMKFPVLWEEKWDCFNDLAIPYWENRISFMSEMMNDATSIGEKWFKSVRTEPKEYFSELDYNKTMLCVDPASTTNKKSDYTAIILGSQTLNSDFVYVRDLVMQRLTFEQYCNKVVETLVKHEDIMHICIEKNIVATTMYQPGNV